MMRRSLLALALLGALTACGKRGDPVPPLASTPIEAETKDAPTE